MKDRAWARNRLGAAVQANLRYWSAQLAAGAVAPAEADNVLTAIAFGQQQPKTRLQAAQVLQAAFGLAVAAGPAGPAWLQLYEPKPAAYPAALSCQLDWQRAVLLWQAGQVQLAQAAFARCQRRSRRLALPRQALAATIGQCLCCLAAGDRAGARTAAARLKAQLSGLRQRPLRLQVLSTLGMAAFFDKLYDEALAYFQQALALAAGQPLRAALLTAGGLCHLGLQDADAALRAYNQAAAHLQRSAAAGGELARIELLRAAAHYAKQTRGQQVRLQPASAALQRAALLLRAAAPNPAARRTLESYIGKVYTRAGDVAAGIEYLTSALQQAEGAGDQRMVADLFSSLRELENKNPAFQRGHI